MCYRIFIHYMVCDVRPLMSTVADVTIQETPYVNPYVAPPSCRREFCPGHGAGFVIPEGNVCSYHPCCMRSAKELRCSKDCCPEQHKGNWKSAYLAHEPDVDECGHFRPLHYYIQDYRKVPSAEKRVAWTKAKLVDALYFRGETGEAPCETIAFIQARTSLFGNMRRLYLLREKLKERMKEFDRTNTSDIELTHSKKAISLIADRYRDAKDAASLMRSSVEESFNNLRLFSRRNEGTLEADFFREARRPNRRKTLERQLSSSSNVQIGRVEGACPYYLSNQAENISPFCKPNIV